MFKLRPTSAKVREAVFNIIKDSLDGCSVLELYAGTGAFSLEAIRQGARFCILVEKDKNQVRKIKEMADKLGILDRMKVINRPVLAALKKIKEKKFNIIFMDPPYKSSQYLKVIEEIDKGELLKPGGKVIVEHYHKKELPEKQGALFLIDSRKYGQTKVSFYSHCIVCGGRQ